jgi:hypothetical protein
VAAQNGTRSSGSQRRESAAGAIALTNGADWLLRSAFAVVGRRARSRESLYLLAYKLHLRM